MSERTFRVVDSPWPNRGKHFDRDDLVWEHESNPEKLVDDDEYQKLSNMLVSPGGITYCKDIESITIPKRLFQRMIWTLNGYFRVRRMFQRWQRRDLNNTQFISELEDFLVKELAQ